jgi:integrase/recombinase XerD
VPRSSRQRPSADLVELLASWELALRAERKSPSTVKTYGDGVRRFLAWCATEARSPELGRRIVAEFITALLDGGAQAATARSRHLALCRFSAWLVEEGELTDDPLLGTKPPKLDVKVVPVLTEEQLTALIKACAGRDIRDRRDEALVRVMTETTMRAGEAVALQVPDVDLTRGLVTVTRGKGGRGRIVPIGASTSRAIDRYIRVRRGHLLAETPALWLGDRGKGFSYDALHKTLCWRGELAGIPGFHPHVLRHTGASRWLAAGGSEGGLMTVAGWQRRDMIDRYTAATASDRAADEARRLGLGEL